MPILSWDDGGYHDYNAGLDRGVLFPSVGPGVAWPGLISITQSSDDIRYLKIYVDGQKVNQKNSSGAFSAELSAFTYPEEFADYCGIYSLNRAIQVNEFGLSWRTILGSNGSYEIHILYLARATPLQGDHKTTDKGSSADTMSWAISTRPIIFDGQQISHLVLRSDDFRPEALSDIEDMLYGSFLTDPKLPSIQDILDVVERYAIFKVTDNGDGTATISGPDEAVYSLTSDTWRLDWPSVVQISGDTYRLSSL